MFKVSKRVRSCVILCDLPADRLDVEIGGFMMIHVRFDFLLLSLVEVLFAQPNQHRSITRKGQVELLLSEPHFEIIAPFCQILCKSPTDCRRTATRYGGNFGVGAAHSGQYFNQVGIDRYLGTWHGFRNLHFYVRFSSDFVPCMTPPTDKGNGVPSSYQAHQFHPGRLHRHPKNGEHQRVRLVRAAAEQLRHRHFVLVLIAWLGLLRWQENPALFVVP